MIQEIVKQYIDGQKAKEIACQQVGDAEKQLIDLCQRYFDKLVTTATKYKVVNYVQAFTGREMVITPKFEWDKNWYTPDNIHRIRVLCFECATDFALTFRLVYPGGSEEFMTIDLNVLESGDVSAFEERVKNLRKKDKKVFDDEKKKKEAKEFAEYKRLKAKFEK